MLLESNSQTPDILGLKDVILYSQIKLREETSIVLQTTASNVLKVCIRPDRPTKEDVQILKYKFNAFFDSHRRNNLFS